MLIREKPPMKNVTVIGFCVTSNDALPNSASNSLRSLQVPVNRLLFNLSGLSYLGALGTWRSLSASVFTSLAPGAILILLYFAAAIPLHLFANVPFHDDWTYAWSVEHFLKTGKLEVLDWSVHYPLAQILWGALFCLPYGFSFSALRVSTVVLAWLGAWALYRT